MHEQEFKPELTWAQKFNLFAGVIMPAISISVEATTHICATTFFDPIPTIWHLLLVTFVPLAQLQVWFAIRSGAPNRLRMAGFANALAIGISIFYTFVYLPLLPLAALFLIVGLGLLPLAPYLSLLSAIIMRVQLKRIAANTPQQTFSVTKMGLLTGLAIMVVALNAIELPATLTRYGLNKASSNSAETRAEGIRFLRSYGSYDYLLRSCYNRTGWATDVIGHAFAFHDPIRPEEARQIYYRVTGEAFETAAPPERLGHGWLRESDFEFDDNQGGTEIGGKIKGLTLASSNLDASVDADGGVGYMQWTLLFQNTSPLQREARAEVQLPPGAVVSRLTLWVNGEEREAAFAGRGKVSEAYQQVVQQRRDPVLVTTSGRDRILVQCFPVPAQNGLMKIRVGLTVPLLLEDRTRARLLLPHFAKTNFRIPDTVAHSVWVDAKTPILAHRIFNTELDPEHSFVLRGAIHDVALSHPDSSISLARTNVGQVWSKDPFETDNFVIKQSVEERAQTHLQRIVLVVDTSLQMREHVWEILAAVRSLPPEFDVKLVLADGDTLYDNSPHALMASGYEEALSKIKLANYEGGADNLPALTKAWDLAAEKAGHNAIVWIHGPQLVKFQSVENLRQRWERRPYGPLLYSVKTSPGADELEKSLDGISEVRSVARMGDLLADLENLFARLTGRIKTLEFVRTSTKMDRQTALSSAYQTSDHLARLWANDEVTRILNARDESLKEAATTLAVRYQLVTSVSGAVVLETAQQYRDAGLTPVEAGTVPTIPEPEMVALIAVVLLFLSWLIYRQRRTGSSGGFIT